VSAANFQAGQAYVTAELISVLWRVSLMLMLKRSFLNKEYILKNVLNFLASIISICSLYIILLSKIKHYAMKAYGGVDLEVLVFLTSALVGSEWSASSLGRFTQGKEPTIPII
jgi:hypothetical protein